MHIDCIGITFFLSKGIKVLKILNFVVRITLFISRYLQKRKVTFYATNNAPILRICNELFGIRRFQNKT